MTEKLEATVDTRIWQAGFDEAMDRMAYWLGKLGHEPVSILRLRGLIETGPIPETDRKLPTPECFCSCHIQPVSSVKGWTSEHNCACRIPKTGLVPETPLQAKRRMLALPIEERREALRKQAEALLRDKPDYGVEE